MMHCAYYKPKFQAMAKQNAEKNRVKRAESIERKIKQMDPVEKAIIDYQKNR